MFMQMKKALDFKWTMVDLVQEQHVFTFSKLFHWWLTKQAPTFQLSHPKMVLAKHNEVN
jgi:hypothetical protein